MEKNKMNPKVMPPLALAFLGDAYMSVRVRDYVIGLGFTKPQDFQKMSIRFVSAKAQAMFVQGLLEENFFSEEELNVYKRGRNAKSLTIPKNCDVLSYKQATGLETLWGYLELSGAHERIDAMWDRIVEMRKMK